MTRARVLAVLLALAALCACGDSTSTGSLASVLVASPPGGYTAQAVSADAGSLSLDDASSATPADPGAVRSFLQGSSWRGAALHVWVRGSDYAEDIAFAFASATDAGRFLHLEVTSLAASPTNYVYALPDIPGAQGFILYSQTRAGARNVFCNGVWFAGATDVFETLTCGATPQDAALATALADAQYRMVGGTPASPSPG